MGRNRRTFSPEFREDAVKMVIDSSRPIAQVARELGIGEATLGNWVNRYRRDHADEEPALGVSERSRLREVERQLREVKMENEFLKKAASYFRPGSTVSEKYEFIETLLTAAEECVYPVYSMCVWLSVSRSGFYDWRTRPDSATAERRAELRVLIGHFFDDSDQTYGYRRIHAELTGSGVQAGPELVRLLMRELGLVPCQPRPFRHCLTVQDAEQPAIPDLLERDFTATAPGTKLVGDIT